MTVDQLPDQVQAWRKRMNLQQREVADYLKIPRSAVAMIESGDRQVSDNEVQLLADLFGITVDQLLQPMHTEELVKILGRIQDEIPDLETQCEITRCINLVQLGTNLRIQLGWQSVISAPVYKAPSPNRTIDAIEQAELVAVQERRRLGLGIRPIPDMSELIASQGIWASGVSMPDMISGLFLTHKMIGIVILVNSRDSIERKRFSYAHEYGHSLFDRDLIDLISTRTSRNSLPEIRANAFAAAFLMPRSGVLEQLSRIDKARPSRHDLDVFFDIERESLAHHRSSAADQKLSFKDIAMLARHFGVNFEPMCYRLKNIRVISRAELKKFLDPRLVETAKSYLAIVRHTDEQSFRRLQNSKRLELEIVNLAIEAYRRGLIEEHNIRTIGSQLSELEIDSDQLVQYAKSAFKSK